MFFFWKGSNATSMGWHCAILLCVCATVKLTRGEGSGEDEEVVFSCVGSARRPGAPTDRGSVPFVIT